MLTFPYRSREQRLEAYVRTCESVHLFTNDMTPAPETVPEDFVEPKASTGYHPVRLAGASWRLEPVGRTVRAISVPVRWLFSGGSDVARGHYALNAAGELLWAERFTVPVAGKQDRDAPFEILRSGDELEITVAVDSRDLQERAEIAP